MEVLGTLIGIAAFLLFIGAFLFYGLAFPIWMIIDAALSERSGVSKVVWIVLVIGLWTVGAVFYGLLGAKKVFIKVFAFLGLLAGAAFVAVISMGIAAMGPLLAQGPEELKAKLTTVAHPAIADEELAALTQHIDTLATEAPFSTESLFANPQKVLVHFGLITKLEEAVADNELTRSELEEWNTLFEARDSLDPEKLGLGVE
ncbi:MAG: PLDc_N domain-containing protein [Bdellovibrionales bacterium]|nr:PLDc_N domain-containing protein [Bdellovibrionales bacterium]